MTMNNQNQIERPNLRDVTKNDLMRSKSINLTRNEHVWSVLIEKDPTQYDWRSSILNTNELGSGGVSTILGQMHPTAVKLQCEFLHAAF